jgi:uncharacterized protein (DUF362 family)/Pyruvate/2-oxoacid:ferredoxin oxidoreductase delta subunit
VAKYHVAFSQCGDYSRLNQAFEELKEKAGFGNFEKSVRGKKVLVKPNIIGPFRQQQAATTHPELVRTVVNWLCRAGAEVIVGDNCGVGGYGLNQLSAKRSGIIEASAGTYRNLAKSVRAVRVDSKFFKKLVISQAVLDVDFIVNLPKLKTHALTLFTLGVKNMFGILAGTSKSRVHSTASDLEDFGEALADIYQIRPPDLTIIDGVVGMDGNGPSHGRIRDIGYLIASHNAPSCDVVIAELAGVEAERVHHLRCTAERGLGPRKFAEVEIGGTCEPILRFRLPSTLVQTRFVGFAINRYLYRSIINSRLVLSEEKCNTCRNCAEACPRSAMRWDGDRPQIDQEKCIRCLCCFELCPEGAWEIKGPLRRLMGKKI